MVFVCESTFLSVLSFYCSFERRNSTQHFYASNRYVGACFSNLFAYRMTLNRKGNWQICEQPSLVDEELKVRGSLVSGKDYDCRAACRHLEIAQGCPVLLWQLHHQSSARSGPGRCSTQPCSDPRSDYLCGSREGKGSFVWNRLKHHMPERNGHCHAI